VEEAGVDSKPGIPVADDVSRRTVWSFAVGRQEAENDEDEDDEEDFCSAMILFSITRMKSGENLKAIRFAGELLPKWAQLLDVAARLCPVSEEVRHWFSVFTDHSGVEDSRTVGDRCRELRKNLETHRETIAVELHHGLQDTQPSQILAAWRYSLDTMIQAAQNSKTCAWTAEGAGDSAIRDSDEGGSDGGEITLRRV